MSINIRFTNLPTLFSLLTFYGTVVSVLVRLALGWRKRKAYRSDACSIKLDLGKKN